MKNRFKPEFAIIAAVFLVMLVFNFATPMLFDDFWYSFSWADGSRMTSITQIMPSIAAHRMSVNGRSFPHAFAQLFLLLPKYVFNFLNAFNCVILMLLARRYYEGSSNIKNSCIMLCGTLAVWNLLPSFGAAFIWLTGSCNYSWSMSFLAAFILPYALAYLKNDSLMCGKDGKFRQKAAPVIFLIVALVAGGYSENGSISAIFAACVFMGLKYIRDRKVDPVLLAGLVIALISFAYMMLSPSERNGRAGDFSVAAIAQSVRYIVQESKAKISPLCCVYFLLLALNWKNGRKEVNVASFVLCLSAFASLAAFAFAAYFVNRHFTYTVIFLIIACQMLLSDLLERDEKFPVMAATVVMAVLFCFNFVTGVIDIGALYMNSQVRQSEIEAGLASGSSVLEITPYYQSSSFSPVEYEDLEDDPESWRNVSVALYYGVDAVYRK